jgi:hypothetical protein
MPTAGSPDPVNATAANFKLREVTADKGYASLNNYDVISRSTAPCLIAPSKASTLEKTAVIGFGASR